jgi:hypothetical protein
MNRPMDQSSKPNQGGKSKSGESAGGEPCQPPPRVMPSYVDKAIARATVVAEPEAEPAPPPMIPFVTDLVTFWGVQAIVACLLTSIGMIFLALADIYCLWLFSQGMGIAVRCFALPLFLISLIVYSYASACFLAIIEGTASGYDKIDDWPTGLWKDWFWTLPSTVGMLVAALMVGSAIGRFMTDTSWVPTLVITFFLYPILQFSVVENGSLLDPVSVPVWKSLRRVWWAWLIFYAVTASGIVLLSLVVGVFFLVSPITGIAVAGVLECACIFLYARLLGRVAWCALKYGDLAGDED